MYKKRQRGIQDIQDIQEGTDLRFHVSAEQVINHIPCRKRPLDLEGTGRWYGRGRVTQKRRWKRER